MMHPKEKITVIDDYFPSWMVEHVSRDLEMMPVRYNNSPYADFEKARFFGSQIVLNDQFIDMPPWWWIEYFNHCMYNDLCKEWTVGHCHRVRFMVCLCDHHGVNYASPGSGPGPRGSGSRRQVGGWALAGGGGWGGPWP